jgi:hypothetical protein
MPQQATPYIPFHVEHVIAKQHGGTDHPDQLALPCDRCNSYKGPNLSSLDFESHEIVPLFHPRTDVWSDHFMLQGTKIIGLSPTGRATVRLLQMNAARRMELREKWLDEGGVIPT